MGKREHEWLAYLKNDVLSTAYSYAIYTTAMEELTRYGMKNSLTLPSLAIKSFHRLRDENNEPIYTYTDEYKRYFVRQSIKGGRCGSFNQCLKSIFSDEVFNLISKELDNIGGVCEILDKCFEFTMNIEK